MTEKAAGPLTADTILEMARQKMFDEFDRSSEMLKTVTENPRLPEDIYVGYFLKDIIEGTLSLVKREQWLSVAGHMAARVDIIDSQSGEYLFTSPGLINTDVVTPIMDRKENIDEIYKRITQLNQLPYLAKQAEFNSFANLSGKLLTNEQIATVNYLHEWKTIYERYVTPEKNEKTDLPKLSDEVPVGFEEF